MESFFKLIDKCRMVCWLFVYPSLVSHHNRTVFQQYIFPYNLNQDNNDSRSYKKRTMSKNLDWTSRVMQEACQSSSWEKLLDAVELRIKKSKNLTKRFAEYTEYEQAVIVEQEIKNVGTCIVIAICSLNLQVF